MKVTLYLKKKSAAFKKIKFETDAVRNTVYFGSLDSLQLGGISTIKRLASFTRLVTLMAKDQRKLLMLVSVIHHLNVGEVPLLLLFNYPYRHHSLSVLWTLTHSIQHIAGSRQFIISFNGFSFNSILCIPYWIVIRFLDST